MFAAAASVMTQAIWSPCSLEGGTGGREVVVRQHDRVGGGRAGDAGGVGQAERGHPGAGAGQQRVDVPVVAAGELHHLRAAGEPAGQPDRAHRRLGAGADEPHLLDRRHPARRSPRPARPRRSTGRRTTSPARPAAVSASTTAGCAWPRIIGPHEPTRSTYSRPSASTHVAARAPETMKRGVPPTARKARTGEFTPPGVTASARSNSAADSGASKGYVTRASLSAVSGRVGRGTGPARPRRGDGTVEGCPSSPCRRSRSPSRSAPRWPSSWPRAAAGSDDESMIGCEVRTFGPTWDDPAAFAEFVAACCASRPTRTRPGRPDWCRARRGGGSTGDDYLGRIALRHRLNERLLELGGHIGYDVRPSARRRGHATAMLAAVLPYAAGDGDRPGAADLRRATTTRRDG